MKDRAQLWVDRVFGAFLLLVALLLIGTLVRDCGVWSMGWVEWAREVFGWS